MSLRRVPIGDGGLGRVLLQTWDKVETHFRDVYTLCPQQKNELAYGLIFLTIFLYFVSGVWEGGLAEDWCVCTCTHTNLPFFQF